MHQTSGLTFYYVILLCEYNQKSHPRPHLPAYTTIFQQFPYFWMHNMTIFSMQIILQRTAIRIFFLLIIFRSRHTVNKHFHHILVRHTHSYHRRLRRHTIINPVFHVVLISPFVMKPCGRISLVLSLCIIRTDISLIIFAANQNSDGIYFDRSCNRPCLYRPTRKQPFMTSIL